MVRLDMRPTRSISYSGYGGDRNAIFGSHRQKLPAVNLYRPSMFLAKLRIPVSAPVSDSAVLDCVGSIRSSIAPIEIVRRIIERVSVSVANKGFGERRGADKSKSNKSVDQMRLRPQPYTKRHLPSPGTANSLNEDARLASATIYSCPFDAPKVGNGIVGGEFNGFPSFHFATLPRNQGANKQGFL